MTAAAETIGALALRAAARWGCVAAMVLLACCAPVLGQDAADAAADQPAIEAGRRAFAKTGTIPWYDATTDDLRPIDVQSTPPRSQTSGPNWSLPSMAPVIWTLLGLMLVALVAALVMAYLKRDRDDEAIETDEVETARPDSARIEALPFPARLGGDLLAQARQCRAAGNFAEAMIYLYSHLLVQLDRHQWIRLTKGKTNRQYVRELAGTPLQPILNHSMTVFEDVFFGNLPLDEHRFAACWNQLPRFEELVRHEVAA